MPFSNRAMRPDTDDAISNAESRPNARQQLLATFAAGILGGDRRSRLHRVVGGVDVMAEQLNRYSNW